MSWKRVVRDRLVARLPLSLRQRAALCLHRQRWLPHRQLWPVLLLRDFAQHQPGEYQRFVWAHGLDRAERFHHSRDFDRLVASRQLLLTDLESLMHSGNSVVPSQVTSVLDAGCSSGFLLHACEDHVFPAARRLLGLDVDRTAMAAGAAWLQRRQSRIELRDGDLRHLDTLLAGERFDVVFCTGVLLYFPAGEAAAIIASLLRHTRQWLVLSGPACREAGNDRLTGSRPRPDFTFVHNFGKMVEQAGGAVVSSRWEGATLFDGQTVYFVFARPAALRPRPPSCRQNFTLAS